jgi:hypothetical protein
MMESVHGYQSRQVYAARGPSRPVLFLRGWVAEHLLETAMNGSNDRYRDSTDGRIERAKDVALGSHDTPPSLGDELGEATGGISGVLVGAGIGSAAGPVGTLIGGVAGALAGWWSGRAVAEAAGALTHEDESYFRAHYDAQTDRPADRAYDDVRGAYYLGHIASHNPNFTAREFDEVEPELERGWAASGEANGSWQAMRRYAQEGFARGRSKLDESARRARAEQEGRTPGEIDDRRA